MQGTMFETEQDRVSRLIGGLLQRTDLPRTLTSEQRGILRDLVNHFGEGRAIAGAELIRVHKLHDDRNLRLVVQDLRTTFLVPICATSAGYWLPATKEDFFAWARQYAQQPVTQLRILHQLAPPSFRRELMGQLTIELQEDTDGHHAETN